MPPSFRPFLRLAGWATLPAWVLIACDDEPMVQPPDAGLPAVAGITVEVGPAPAGRASAFVDLAEVDGAPFLVLHGADLDAPLAGLQLNVAIDGDLIVGPAATETDWALFDDAQADGTRQLLMFSLDGETLLPGADPLLYFPIDLDALGADATTITVTPRVLADNAGRALDAGPRTTTIRRSEAP